MYGRLDNVTEGIGSPGAGLSACRYGRLDNVTEVLDPLELALEIVVSCCVWVLRLEPPCSARTSAGHPRAISPAPVVSSYFLSDYFVPLTPPDLGSRENQMQVSP